MAIHCGINLYTIERLKKQGYRYGGLVSKGGTYMVSWMMVNGKENPLYEQFDRVAGIPGEIRRGALAGQRHPRRGHR